MIPEPEEWETRAACRGSGSPDLWFPPRWQPVSEAKRICRTCPVREECLRFAMENHIQYGIWGGRSERERKQLRSRRVSDERASA